jgi:hypothetical protein
VRVSFPAAASLLLAIGLVTAAGCGSEDDEKEGPLSQTELVEQANAICRRADAPDPPKDTVVPFNSLRQLKGLYRGDAQRARRADRELGRLDIRPEDRPKLRALRKSFGQLVLTNEKAGGITALPEIRLYGALSVAANRVAFERAAALGARHCPPLTASGSYLTAVNRNKKAGDPVPPPASERTEKAEPPAEKAEEPKPEPNGGHPVLGRWKGRITQYGPRPDQRIRYREVMNLRSATVGEVGGRWNTPPECSGALQVEAATDRAVVYLETITRGGKKCYGNARTRVERRGERLTYRSTAKTRDGRAVSLGTLTKAP